MSDLIEQLRRERSADVQDAADRLEEQELLIEAQQAEIAQLRELVEEAYGEGYSDGLFADPLHTYHEDWSVSDTRRTLEQKS